MKFKILNVVETIVLLITFQVLFIRAIIGHHIYKEFIPSTFNYLDNDSSLSLKNIYNNKDNLEIILRYIRQVNLNNEINQDINKINVQISNLSDTIMKESSKIQSNSNSTFSRPNSGGKFTNLGNEIKKMKEDIEKLKNTPSIEESIKLKIHGLEVSVETLQKVFDDKNRELGTQVENLETFVDYLTDTVGDLRRELNRINHLLDEKEHLENQRLLPAEIIRDIKGRDFDNAIKNIQKLNNSKKQVNYIVHEVYSNNAGNFDLILQLGNSSASVELALLVYEALIYEMESNSYNDPLKLLKLINNIESNAFQSLPPGNTLNEVEMLQEKLSNLMSEIIAKILRDATKAKDYDAVSDLLDKMYEIRLFWYTKIVRQVVSIMIDKIDAETLVRFFKSCKYYGQKIFGYNSLFFELRTRSQLNQRALVTLAMDLKYGKKEIDYYHHKQGYDVAIGLAIAEIKILLPRSVRRLVFSDCLNIKRAYNNEYLVTAKGRIYNWEKHDVYISSLDIRSFGLFKWTIQPAGDDYYYIKNNYTNQYLVGRDDGFGPRQKLCTENMDPSDEGMFWVRNEWNRWIFEPSNHSIYIKNVQIDKYMYVGSWDDSTLKFVAWGNKANESLWTVEECYYGE